MDCQHLGVEVQQPPNACGCRGVQIGDQIKHPVVALVLPGRIVDRNHHDVGPTTEIGQRDRGARVVPKPPVRHRGPRPPPLDRTSGPVQPPPHGEVTPVWSRRVVDLEHQQLGAAIAVQVGHGRPRPLVLPGKPVRDRRPIAPPAGHHAGGVQPPADPVVGRVRPLRRVDHEDDELRAAVPVQVGHGKPTIGVLPGKPVRDQPPVAPATGEVPGLVQRSAHPIGRCVRPGRIIDCQDNDIGVAVAVHIGDGDPDTCVLPPWPIRNRHEVGRHHAPVARLGAYTRPAVALGRR